MPVSKMQSIYLVQALDIRLDESDGQIIASFKESEVECLGYGETTEEAVSELIQQALKLAGVRA